MYFAAKVERIKKDNDVQTYKEIVAFVKVKGWMKSRAPENTANVLIKRFYGLSEVLQ